MGARYSCRTVRGLTTSLSVIGIWWTLNRCWIRRVSRGNCLFHSQCGRPEARRSHAVLAEYASLPWPGDIDRAGRAVQGHRLSRAYGQLEPQPCRCLWMQHVRPMRTSWPLGGVRETASGSRSRRSPRRLLVADRDLRADSPLQCEGREAASRVRSPSSRLTERGNGGSWRII